MRQKAFVKLKFSNKVHFLKQTWLDTLSRPFLFGSSVFTQISALQRALCYDWSSPSARAAAGVEGVLSGRAACRWSGSRTSTLKLILLAWKML